MHGSIADLTRATGSTALEGERRRTRVRIMDGGVNTVPHAAEVCTDGGDFGRLWLQGRFSRRKPA